MKKFAFAVLAAVAALALVSCAPEAPKTIKIGTIQPLTGVIAVYGKNVTNAVQLAVDEVNAAGGIGGKQVELVVEDDSAKADNTVAAFKKLTTKDKVIAIVGALTSSCTLSITELAQSAKLPLITPTSTNDKVTTAGDYVFQACYKDSFQGKVDADFAATTLKAKTVAILFDNANDYSKGLKTNFEAEFTKAGGTVVSESYATGDKDFNAQIAKVKASKPDALFLPDYYNVVSLLAKQIRAAGITVPLLGADGWDDAVGTDNADLVGAYYTNHFSKEAANEPAKVYLDAYKAKYGSESDALAALGYDATKILLNAIAAADKAGKLTSDEIRAQLAATQGTFVTGDISFDANRTTVKPAVIVQINKGDDKKLFTKFVATVNP